MTTLALPPTPPDLSKFKSYGILENPMWIEWEDSMQMFFVHEKGHAHESQPWKMPLETLERTQRELKLQAGSAIDFRRLPQERRDTFARYIDCMVRAFADGKDVQERMAMAKPFNAPPALDDPELDRAAGGLTVDVDMATGGRSSPQPYQVAAEGAAYRMFKHFKAFDGTPHVAVLADHIEREVDQCPFYVNSDRCMDYLIKEICTVSNTINEDERAYFVLTEKGLAHLRSEYEPTSPIYSPTSPIYSPTSPGSPPVQNFDNVPLRMMDLPDNWKERWNKEDMEKLVSYTANLTECYNAMILDIHHGNVPLSCVTPRMGLGTYAKYLQPKKRLDCHMTQLMDKLDEPPSEEEPSAKRSRSGSPLE